MAFDANGSAIAWKRSLPCSPKRKVQKKNPTGKRIRRDDWIAPLTLDPKTLINVAQPNKEGVRVSDKGFLGISLADYLRLLGLPAKQSELGSGKKEPHLMQGMVSPAGIDLSMWRDLDWNFQMYFGCSCCAGSPEGMSGIAESTGRHWAKGHRQVADWFMG